MAWSMVSGVSLWKCVSTAARLRAIRSSRRLVSVSAVLQDWSKAAKKFAGFPASARQTFRAVYDVLLKLTKVLDEAGVPMLAGSDSGGAAWEVPGLALHQEFDELARAGLSPLRILQMTTWNAAEFMNATDVMGSVAAGKHADLVLLDANPVESVEHMNQIIV
jgi:imidazolonepropionase-like amidohydrolase